MKFNRVFALLLLTVVLVLPAVFNMCAAGPKKSSLTAEQRKLNLESFEYVWTTIRDKHYDPKLGELDWQAVYDELKPKMEKAKSMSEARAVLKDLISRLKQSHFNIIPLDVYDKLGQPAKYGSWGGVTGIDIRVLDGHALVTSVLKDSPAHKAGVNQGWEVLRIGKKDIPPLLPDIAKEFEGNSWKDLVLSNAVESRLVGKIGLTLNVRFRDGNDKEVELDIPLAEQKGKKFQLGHLPPFYTWIDTETMAGNIGYIAFNAFLDVPRVMPAFNKAMKTFIDTGVNGIVIDIRGNGGGLPGMAMGMCGWLIAEKDLYLGTIYLRNNELKIVVRPRPDTYNGPVAVLVDGLSASCSEIFAGGLKDLGRAHIFGSTTAGAVLPATIEKLANGDGFQYAIADYNSVKGGRLEGVGVVPDKEVYPTREALLQGRDLVLEAAVDWIKKIKNNK